jgi:uncharacterized membrane protein
MNWITALQPIDRARSLVGAERFVLRPVEKIFSLMVAIGSTVAVICFLESLTVLFLATCFSLVGFGLCLMPDHCATPATLAKAVRSRPRARSRP